MHYQSVQATTEAFAARGKVYKIMFEISVSFRLYIMSSPKCNINLCYSLRHQSNDKKLILPYKLKDNELISLHELPEYSDDIIPYNDDQLPDIPQPEDYYDDVHISLDSIIDAGKNWLVINKPSFLSLDDDPNTNNKYSVKSRLLSFLQRPQNQFVANQIGLNSFWWEKPQIYFPYPLDKGVSGSLPIAFNRDVYDFITNEYNNNSILESMLAIVHYKNAFGLKTFDFRSNEIWANFEAELIKNKTNYKDIEGKPKHERIDIYSKWRCVATDNDEDGFALLQFQYKRKVKHEIRRLCALNRTPIVGEDRYIDIHKVDIEKGIGNLGDMTYQPLLTKLNRHRYGLHVGRLKFVAPNEENVAAFKQKQDKDNKRHENILDLRSDKRHRKNHKSPLPKEFKNLFSLGLKSRAPRFAVDV